MNHTSTIKYLTLIPLSLTIAAGAGPAPAQNLALNWWSLDGGGDMFPYTEQDRERVHDFFSGALLEGPFGDGEEARVVSETLGQSRRRTCRAKAAGSSAESRSSRSSSA